MVGARKKCAPMAPAFTQQHTLSRRRCAHRRRVDGSGERDGSLQCGAACSTEVTGGDVARRPAAGNARLKGAEGASQSGKIVKVFRHGSTDSASHPNAFVAVIVGLAEPPSMADDRVVAANRTSPRQEIQRDHPGSMLSFASGSAIKRITAGVKARR